MLPANRWILDKRDGVRFLFIEQVIEKVQKKLLSFLFVGLEKLCIMQLFFEEFNHIFFTAERLACFEKQLRQRRFGEFWGTFLTLWSEKLRFKKEIYVFINI